MSACSTEEDDNATTAVSTNPLARINLSWIAPAERENNTALSLSEIAGFRLYYGTVHGDYIYEIHIEDGSAENYTLTDFPGGTYYFVVTTYDTDGRESRVSPEIVITI